MHAAYSRLFLWWFRSVYPVVTAIHLASFSVFFCALSNQKYDRMFLLKFLLMVYDSPWNTNYALDQKLLVGSCYSIRRGCTITQSLYWYYRSCYDTSGASYGNFRVRDLGIWESK